MSPLIDCVFLLLIFFLATTMLKKKEKQIPVNMPDMNLSSSSEASPAIRVITLGSDNRFYTMGERQTGVGRVTYKPIDGDLGDFLSGMSSIDGVEAPIRLDVPRNTRFARIVELLDLFQNKEFDNVSLRLLDDYSARRMLESN